MPWQQIREKVNLLIYDSKSGVLKGFARVNTFVTLLMIAALVYYYGFPVSDLEKMWILRTLQFFFGFYILYYLTKIFYDFAPDKFIRNTRWEALMIVFLMLEGILFAVTGRLLSAMVLEWLGYAGFESVNEVFIPIYFFILLIIELFSGERKFAPIAKLHPALIFILSISGLVAVGTVLLLLPEMTYNGISFVDALFMSTSAVSVTGLAPLDVAADFTQKGQIVILFLFQLGGLNAIAFGALFFLFLKMGVGSKHHEIIEDFVNKGSLLEGSNMFRKIVVWTIRIELVGIALLFLFLPNEGMFSSTKERLFYSIFQGVSAFNNAGISNIPDGMANELLRHSYSVHFVTLVLFFLGGFGMIYLFDLFEVRKLRERLKFRWKTIEFGTKITLYFTLAFLLLGAMVMLLFEHNKTMEGMTWPEKIFHAFYFSATTRNAGFSLYDTATLSLPVMIIFLFLMFVGAGSGSAAGGIRVSTFGVLWASVVSTIRNRQHVEIFKRTIDNGLVFKAAAITIFFAIGNLLGIFALSITESAALESGWFSLMDIIFEHVSAASTVGLSTGITPDLSTAGKVVLVVAMFIGRVGTLTVAYLLSQRGISRGYKYPEAHTMVG
jgi:trk system potassium uptake protein